MTRCCRDVLLIVLLSVVLGGSFAQTALSDFLKSKVLRLFFVLDVNGDGVIQQPDYVIIFDNILNQLNYGKYSRTVMEGEKVSKAWGIFPQGPVNQAQLLGAAAQLVGTAQMNQTASDLGTLMLDVCDYLPIDGALSVNEFTGYFQSLKIDTTLAPNAFLKLDTNHDGKISLDEFIAAHVFFFLSNDPNDASRYLLAV